MCLICVHFEQSKLTNQEAWNNLSEMRSTIDEEPAQEVEDMIVKAEAENIKLNLEELFKDMDDDNPFEFDFGGFEYLGIGDEE